MTVVATALTVAGGFVAVLAGIGVLRFDTTYARLHAAGKASPVAFLVAAIGVGIEVGAAGAIILLIAATAMILTLPVGVHLLFRAVHRTGDNSHLLTDDLAPAENRALQASRQAARKARGGRRIRGLRSARGVRGSRDADNKQGADNSQSLGDNQDPDHSREVQTDLDVDDRQGAVANRDVEDNQSVEDSPNDSPNVGDGRDDEATRR